MSMADIKRMAYKAGVTEEEFGLSVGWGDLERFVKLVLAENPPSTWMSYQEGFEAGNRLAVDGFCRQLRQLHDSYSLSSDSNAIKAALEAKDEPVAQPEVRTGNCLRVGVCASEGHKIQPQRTWVGLTDEDINSVRYKRDWTAPWTDTTFARAIEAKLKEKNT
jgi:hypothetical protein